MNKCLGFNGTTDAILAIWEQNAKKWPGTGSPWRPSSGDIRVYKELSGVKLPGAVLILGATPEIRDMVAAYDRPATIVDISSTMYDRMSLLLKKASPARERFIRADWSSMPFQSETFDLVVGDMVWWVLSVETQRAVRDALWSCLKPDGLFVARFRVSDRSRIGESYRDILTSHLNRLSQDPSCEHAIRGEMLSCLYDHTADAGLLRLNRERARDILLEAAESREYEGHRLFLRDAATRLIGADWTSQTKEEVLASFDGRFSVLTEAFADDYESSWYPVFACQKR
ncbi:MAG: hypothetical protein A3I44_00370 [Candidatus Sungbacteria bacterium RIFCSPLOWO2_02_FULL_51_17]|uniref:Methyltransferase domain-containing protein n=1 Tax=Candidatus Sungbacteria bacterium RIFCSPHIGHO2_02_FULL_51_29 TaxID=1802273 RepID=A0A1G2KPV5_9BACT|nr:MAG: hypothetical protein A2676_04755 [Candidatus Sungbacteria bacterium RIFCSPHIGHO2_01_FULL_51_22]OHA01284.1 MAG: hypothetical protein A3C16_01945 [Candidatus Sungbacteria bacterium RIFCSPHIGHO2_02_FULL_51_29]OHA06487.1 MAG: hypothetical protein A3B29_05510 [Candidatus Sungbacteria bacterium RIFCSPLOWO2_01_FULL_51_34]OHA12549.1 MAG: hypothetical protein A3I44_00370 [Candidatus Sungbacteria bacterium RIFCSPLOWO2_02_FULL_51_17]